MMTPIQLSEIRNRAIASEREKSAVPRKLSEVWAEARGSDQDFAGRELLLLETRSHADEEFLERGPSDVLALLQEIADLHAECARLHLHTKTFADVCAHRDDLARRVETAEEQAEKDAARALRAERSADRLHARVQEIEAAPAARKARRS